MTKLLMALLHRAQPGILSGREAGEAEYKGWERTAQPAIPPQDPNEFVEILEGWRVLILPSGAHYDCASEEEAREIMSHVPQSDEETGRQITLDHKVVETEWRAA